MSLKQLALALALVLVPSLAHAQPASIRAEGVPALPESLLTRLAPYLDSRSASLYDWHPSRREMLIGTRFADVTQIHRVAMPLGARRQLTFFPDSVVSAQWEPDDASFFVFGKDTGGGEFYQLYRYDYPVGRTTLLTDGKSRNTGVVWSNGGDLIAFSSTRRNGADTDIWLMNPRDPSSARMLLERSGGGWRVLDWSPADDRVLVGEYVSANESHLWIADVKSGTISRVTPEPSGPIAWGDGRFAPDGRSIYTTTDADGEFAKLVKIDLTTKRRTAVAGSEWDVDSFELSDDGRLLAWLTNDAGVGVLHVRDLTSGKDFQLPAIPAGTIGNIAWRPHSRELGFNLSSASSPNDVYSIDLATGTLTRWTESETGGLDASLNVEPELVKMRSFDGLPISAFVYRADAKRFPGKRPVIISIHGGPEGQSRPMFMGRTNFFMNEMGITLVYPNVRGSTGYGKTYLALDNATKREDSVRDIGTVLDWIASDPKLDNDRVLVYGGSYGGYMVLASMIHFADRLRAGIDVVGISDFVTFLTNTQSYRRDLRRAEYGDERDPAILAYLNSISPLRQAGKIKDPLLVIQGFNDPRVPYTESEQIVAKLRENEVPVWYVVANDEGHGFRKRVNQDYQLAAMVMFIERYLLDGIEAD